MATETDYLVGYELNADFGSTTPLADNGDTGLDTYTSAAISDYSDGKPVRYVLVAVKTDKAGTVTINGSVDGVNWDALNTASTIVASTLLLIEQKVYTP